MHPMWDVVTLISWITLLTHINFTTLLVPRSYCMMGNLGFRESCRQLQAKRSLHEGSVTVHTLHMCRMLLNNVKHCLPIRPSARLDCRLFSFLYLFLITKYLIKSALVSGVCVCVFLIVKFSGWYITVYCVC